MRNSKEEKGNVREGEGKGEREDTFAVQLAFFGLRHTQRALQGIDLNLQLILCR